MSFDLTEEQIAVRDAARDFAQKELLPGVIERDNEQRFPKEQVKMMGELGFMGMMVDPKYGVWILSRMYWPWRKSLKSMRQPLFVCRLTTL